MNPSSLTQALTIGVERLSGWADLLDDINVYPVADGDTGRNLLLSLAPLRQVDGNRDRMITQLQYAARGNSGNIAVAFLSSLVQADTVQDLPRAVLQGRDHAVKAVSRPQQGTMLDIFDALAGALEAHPELDVHSVTHIVDILESAVKDTTAKLPQLAQAGVVDAGALGMFIYLDGFFNGLTGTLSHIRPILEVFNDRLAVARNQSSDSDEGHCVDMLIQLDGDPDTAVKHLSDHGHHLIVGTRENGVKVHIHTQDPQQLFHQASQMGRITAWSQDDLKEQILASRNRLPAGPVHVMTDAAGSITRDDARYLGLTLLDSYIVNGPDIVPETLADPEQIYHAMRHGAKLTTAQASVFERHEIYQRVTDQYSRVVYLCVGSVYTGNYEVATQWKQDHDRHDRLTVVDTGTASGRLGLLALLMGRLAATASDPETVIRAIGSIRDQCREYVFLDKLKYLANGGRLSWPQAFFGDLLNKKPVISPLASGAQKVGMVRNQAEQIAFALEKLHQELTPSTDSVIMVQYSDNRDWLASQVVPMITREFPDAEIRIQPLSLTSGVHMGPGTWAVAFYPVRS